MRAVCVHFDSFRRQPPSAGPNLLERESAENANNIDREIVFVFLCVWVEMKTRKREGDTTQEQEERGGDKEIERKSNQS